MINIHHALPSVSHFVFSSSSDFLDLDGDTVNMQQWQDVFVRMNCRFDLCRQQAVQNNLEPMLWIYIS